MLQTCAAGRQVVTLMYEMKAQMDVLAHQQQQILHELAKNRLQKPVPTLPDGISLPCRSLEQLIALDKRIKRILEHRNMMVNIYCCHYSC